MIGRLYCYTHIATQLIPAKVVNHIKNGWKYKRRYEAASQLTVPKLQRRCPTKRQKVHTLTGCSYVAGHSKGRCDPAALASLPIRACNGGLARGVARICEHLEAIPIHPAPQARMISAVPGGESEGVGVLCLVTPDQLALRGLATSGGRQRGRHRNASGARVGAVLRCRPRGGPPLWSPHVDVLRGGAARAHVRVLRRRMTRAPEQAPSDADPPISTTCQQAWSREGKRPAQRASTVQLKSDITGRKVHQPLQPYLQSMLLPMAPAMCRQPARRLTMANTSTCAPVLLNWVATNNPQPMYTSAFVRSRIRFTYAQGVRPSRPCRRWPRRPDSQG